MQNFSHNPPPSKKFGGQSAYFIEVVVVSGQQYEGSTFQGSIRDLEFYSCVGLRP